MTTARDRTREATDEPLPALDARLVPPALAAWAAALVPLTLGWGPGALLTVLALVVTTLGGRRLHAARQAGSSALRWAAGLLATGICAGAVGGVASTAAHQVAGHPLRAAADAGSAATLEVVLTDDPTPLRSTGLAGDARVVVRAELAAAQAAGARWRGDGRVVLLAPAAGWAGLLPGQRATASGTLGPSTRGDLTVAVLRTRGPPRDVGPAPGVQLAAGDLRAGLRDAARAVLGEEPAALLPGLVVGDTSGIGPDLDDDFRTAGLTHLLAVSGLTAEKAYE